MRMETTKILNVDEAAEIVRGNANETEKMNALVGATITILGTEFFVEIVKKAEGGYTLLLVPTKPENPAKVKIGKLIEDVKKLIGKDVDTSELQNIVNGANGNETDDFDTTEISLAMAFVYIDKKGENEKTAEYAFQLKAELEGLVPKELEDFVTIKDAQVAVWNTGREKIINAMNLVKPEEYL